jgi:hypothetical protein
VTRFLLAVLAVLGASAAIEVGLPALVPPGGMRVATASQPLSAPARVVGGGPIVRLGGLQPLFADVPSAGYPHDTYTAGNCTWWVAFNRRVPPYLGDGWQWLGNAVAQGMATSPEPAVGAIVVYRASPGYDVVHGHVAVVIAVGTTSFRVSEMNFLGLGVVDERDSTWPDWHVEGFIPR